MIESKHKLRKVEKRFGLSDHYFHITMTTKVILKWLEKLLRRLSPTPKVKLSRFLQFDFDIFVEYWIASKISFQMMIMVALLANQIDAWHQPISKRHYTENVPDIIICIFLSSSGPVLAVHEFRKFSEIMF